MKESLNIKQQQALQMGQIRRQQLIKATQKFAHASLEQDYPHSYIYSLGGLGKTFNVTKSLDEVGLPYVVVSGKASDFGFALMLAVTYNMKPKGIAMRIVVDDCDAILSPSFINTLKNMLEGQKKLVWNQYIPPHTLDTQEKIDAIEALKTSVGFEIPCDEFIFLFTSNYRLPNSNEALAAEAKGPSTNAQKIINLNAIRTRVKSKDIIFENDMEWWGWIADAVINDGSVKHIINKEQEIILLRWMWNNWQHLSGRCLRTVNQLADVMKWDSEDYEDEWGQDYIDHISIKSNKIGNGSL
jgi:hypothetical protein